MSTQDALWALKQANDLSQDERRDAIAQLKASEWSLLRVPVRVGKIMITGMTVVGPVVEFTGRGGDVDWPLRLVNAPISVLDLDGPDVDEFGNRSRVDCQAVLSEVLGRFQ